jgi:hypothetical protein
VSESPLEIFKRQFPTITQMVERSDNYRLDVALPYDAIGIGSAATVLVRHRNARAFGFSWHIDLARLHGLRSRCFDGTKPDEHSANAEWLAELARRLSTDGATNAEVYGALSHKWKQSRHHIKRALARRAY